MLGAVVFVCGAAVMAIEIVGARILAPRLGSSIVIWSGLIGVVMAALALGYFWGGRLADRRPEPRLLAVVILLAAVFTTLTAALKDPILLAVSSLLPDPRLAVLAAGLALFAPAGALLGMVAPFAVRLGLPDAASVGRTSGALYALSTAGSIAGTFLTGFWLIALMGSSGILLCTAAALCAASLLAAPPLSRVTVLPALFVCILAGAAGLWQQQRGEALAAHQYFDVDTPYSRILVYDAMERETGRILRVMSTGPERFQSARYEDAHDDLALPYTRFLRLALYLAPRGGRLLVLGGGACSFPRRALQERPDLSVTVVELDPGVTDLARRHFGLTAMPGLRVVHEDARTFLTRATAETETYDAVIMDVFDAGYAVPFHVSSLEALSVLRRLLSPGGSLIVNSISALEGPAGLPAAALASTVRAVFDNLGVYALDGADRPGLAQNVMLLAGRDGLPGEARLAKAGADPDLAPFLARALDPEAAERLAGRLPPLTDEHGPAEWYAMHLSSPAGGSDSRPK